MLLDVPQAVAVAGPNRADQGIGALASDSTQHTLTKLPACDLRRHPQDLVDRSPRCPRCRPNCSGMARSDHGTDTQRHTILSVPRAGLEPAPPD